MAQLRDLPASAFAISLIGADTEKETDLGEKLKIAKLIFYVRNFLFVECTPVIDGDFLPSTVDEMRKCAPPKPRMTGVAKMEGLLFCEFLHFLNPPHPLPFPEEQSGKACRIEKYK